MRLAGCETGSIREEYETGGEREWESLEENVEVASGRREVKEVLGVAEGMV